MSNKFKIGYTPWESTKVPSSWYHNMHMMDEIWATSNFVKSVYSNQHRQALLYTTVYYTVHTAGLEARGI